MMMINLTIKFRLQAVLNPLLVTYYFNDGPFSQQTFQLVLTRKAQALLGLSPLNDHSYTTGATSFERSQAKASDLTWRRSS